MLRNNAKILLAILALFVGATTRSWAVEISYAVKTSGAVSLGIYDAQKRLVRTLQSGKKIKEPGAYKLEWDGKDDLGRLLPSGPYTYQGLSANVGWEYQLMMGNAGKPPYLTSDGKGGWGGVHGHVKDAVVDAGGTNLYLLWEMEEGTPALLKVNPHGGTGQFVLWGAHNINWSWGACQAVATDGEYVYVANNVTVDSPTEKGKKRSRGLIWRVKADSGEYANNYPGEDGGLLKVYDLAVESLPSLPASWEMYADPAKRRSESFGWNLFGLAVDNARLYCSLRVENKIVIFDKKTGALVKEVAVAEPAGLAMAPDGNVYAISGQTLVKLSPEGKLVGKVIETGLVAPYDLCVDGKGQIYVSDQATAMQVKVFSAEGPSTGSISSSQAGSTSSPQAGSGQVKLLKTIGKAGGREYGGEWARMKKDLLYPTGPAMTADGTLYVGEDCAPKRVAIFKKGKWADEWVGPLASGCAKMDIADEAEPEYVYQSYYPTDLVRYRVDYAKKTFTLDAVWGYFGAGPIKRDGVFSTGEHGGSIRHVDGKTFLCTCETFYRIEGYKLIPCATVSSDYGSLVSVISASWKSCPTGGLAKAKFNVWRDKNGDWEAQENEVDWTPPPGSDKATHSPFAGGGIRPFVAPNMDLYEWGWKLPFLGLDERGNPIYSWAKAERQPLRPMGVLADPKIGWWSNSAVSNVAFDVALDIPGGMYPYGVEVNMGMDPDDGGYYFACDIGGKGKGIGWASSGIFARIGKLDRSGNWIWMAGEKATGFVKPGQFYKPGEFAGIIKGCLFITDWNGQMRIFDKNTGLYVGSLFSDGYKGAKPDENLVAVEYNEAHVYSHPKTGEDYALAGDGEGLKLFRVTGLRDIQRFNGAVTLNAETK